MATFDELRRAYPNLSDDSIAEMANVALRLANDKKTRKGFLGLIKEHAPDTPIPEIDEVRAVNDEIAKRDKRIEDLEQKFNDRLLQQDLAAKKRGVQERYSLSDEDMKKLEERMGKKELPADYEWAARLHQQETQVATPTNYGTGGFGPLDLEHNAKGLDGLLDDTDNWASRTAHQMIDDMQKRGKAPAF